MAEAKVGVEISAEDKASRTLSDLDSRFKSLQKTLKDDVAPAFEKVRNTSAVAFAAIAGLGVTSLQAYADAQHQMTLANTSLENALKSMGDVASGRLASQLGGTKNVMQGLQDVMAKTSKAAIQLGFDDEDTSVAFAKLFAVTKDVTETQRELKIAMDFSAYSGKSLEEVTMAMARAHAGSTKELKSLGVAVEDGTTAMDVFRIMSERAGGAAAKAAEDISVKMQVLQIELQNVRENIGAALAPALEMLLTKVQPIIDRVTEWTEKNPELIAKLLLVAGAATGLVLVLSTLGLAVISITAAFTPVGLIVGAIALAIAGLAAVALYFYENWTQIMDYVDEKTGLVTLLRDAWQSISDQFTQFLLPALQDLWASLQPYKPFLEALGQVIGTMLVIAVGALVLSIKGWILIIENLLELWARFVVWVNTNLLPIFSAIGDAIAAVWNWVNRLIEAFSKLSVVQSIGSSIGGAFSAVGHAVGINDGIVQNGQVITTHPDDYIIATKDPSSLGGGKNININISGAVLTQEAARTLGDMILGELRLQFKI